LNHIKIDEGIFQTLIKACTGIDFLRFFNSYSPYIVY